jgi:hypothetical protein
MSSVPGQASPALQKHRFQVHRDKRYRGKRHRLQKHWDKRQ